MIISVLDLEEKNNSEASIFKEEEERLNKRRKTDDDDSNNGDNSPGNDNSIGDSDITSRVIKSPLDSENEWCEFKNEDELLLDKG